MDSDPVRRAIAGSVGGVVEACLLLPIDSVKTKMQLQPCTYSTFVGSARTIVAREGVGSLWKGLTPFTMHLTTKYALRFGGNAWLAGKLADDRGRLSWPRQLLAGFGAGALEAACVPLDVVKVRLQQGQTTTTRASHVVRDILRKEGARALWAGIGPTVARNGIQQATMFSVKPKVDEAMFCSRKKRPWESMVSGTIAAVPGLCLSNFFDVLRVHMAVKPGQRAWAIAESIWRSSGVAGFYRGLGARLMRVPPGIGIVWTIVDALSA